MAQGSGRIDPVLCDAEVLEPGNVGVLCVARLPEVILSMFGQATFQFSRGSLSFSTQGWRIRSLHLYESSALETIKDPALQSLKKSCTPRYLFLCSAKYPSTAC